MWMTSRFEKKKKGGINYLNSDGREKGREKVQLALKPAGAQLDFWNVYPVTMSPHSIRSFLSYTYTIHS